MSIIADYKDDYPIPYHETFDIHDPSKLQTYLVCPRKYFYEYVLGWQPKFKSFHLTFGTAWHEAMEYLLLNGYTKENVSNAYDAFMAVYREEVPESYNPEEHRIYKTPDIALRTLELYVEKYKGDLERFDVLKTEMAVKVPIRLEDEGGHRTLYGKMDSILRKATNGMVFSLEHKTASRDSGAWADQWSNKLQIYTYYHALNFLYGNDNVDGITVNGVFFKKTESTFARVPVRKSRKMLLAWLHTVNAIFDNLENDFINLAEQGRIEKAQGKHLPVLNTFHMNMESCFKYGTCKYLPYCAVRANPLEHVDRMPDDLTERRWNPVEEFADTKHVVDIDPTLSTPQADNIKDR